MNLTSTLQFRLLLACLFLSSSTSFAQLITTIAGNGTNSLCGDGGQATSACVQTTDVAVDASGNLYIAGSIAIRKVTPAGIITTFAGGTSGTAGDGGLAVNAQFLDIRAIVTDATGNVYVSDGNRIRKISTTGIITTIAGGINSGFGGDNGPATAALFYTPQGLAIDAMGNMFIADTHNKRIRKINTSGIVSTVAGNGIGGYSNGIATQSMMQTPADVAVDAAGNLFITDCGNWRIRKVSTSGMMSTICGTGVISIDGDGGPAVNAHAGLIQGIAVDAGGNIYFSANNCVRVIAAANNNIYKFAGSNSVVGGFSGDGGVAVAALMNVVSGITLDASNNLYIADNNNYRVRKVNACTAPPAQPGIITGPGEVCPWIVYNYSVPAGNNYMYYEWTLPLGWSISGNGTGNAVAVNSTGSDGTVTVTANNLCGTSTPSLPLTIINAGAGVNITPAGPYVTLCQDNIGQGSVQLSVNVPPGLSVEWHNMYGPIMGAINPTYDVTLAGMYHAVVTSTLGCSGNSNGVIVEALNPMISGPYFGCQGDSTMLIAVTGTMGPTTYQWQFNGVDIPAATNDTLMVATTGAYTLEATGGCSNTSPIFNYLVVDTPAFTVTTSGPLTFCPGGSVQLQVNTIMASDIEWYKDGNIVGWFNYTATTPGHYTVLLTDNNDCISTATYSVSIDTPQATILASGPTTFCYGDQVQLNANTGTGYSYQWQLNGTNLPGATNSNYPASMGGNYSVIVNEGLCIDTSTAIMVTVDTPHADITTTGGTTFCEGNSVQLDANTGLGYTYQWMLNGAYIPGFVTGSYTATATGDYAVIVDEGMCMDTADIVIVTVNPLPTITITQNSHDLSVPPGFISYQWYLNGVAINGATSETYTAMQDGDYYVIVSDGCEGQSNTVTVSQTGIVLNNLSKDISIYPHPLISSAKLTFNNSYRQPHTFKLYNVHGALVRSAEDITTGEVNIERGILPAGVYYYQLNDLNATVGVGKIIIQ